MVRSGMVTGLHLYNLLEPQFPLEENHSSNFTELLKELNKMMHMKDLERILAESELSVNSGSHNCHRHHHLYYY